MKQKTAHTLEIVKGLEAFDSPEEAHINDTIAWIESGAPIFRITKPDTPDKHLVAYFVLFDERNAKILLTDHRKSGLWLPAGGHVEINEDPKETVRRECMEELSVQADFWREDPLFLTSTVTVGITAGHVDVSLWYVLKGDSDHSYAFDEREFKSIRWFGFDDIPYEKSDPHMERFIKKLKTQMYNHRTRQ